MFRKQPVPVPPAEDPDVDDDGMADAWELANGLDPSDPNDHSTIMPSGYTAIEDYINQLADAIVGIFSDDFEGGDTSSWSS